MSNVNNINSTTPTAKITAPAVAKSTSADAPALPKRAADRVELSGITNILAALKRNDVRADKVASIKAQLDAGTYEDDKKVDVASDRLLDDLLK